MTFCSDPPSFRASGFASPIHEMGRAHIDLNHILIPHPNATYFMRVSGHQMRHMGIDEGDYLIVDRSLTPIHNQAVIIEAQGEFLVRRWYHQKGIIRLTSDCEFESSCSPLFDEDWQVWGVITYIIQAPQYRTDQWIKDTTTYTHSSDDSPF